MAASRTIVVPCTAATDGRWHWRRRRVAGDRGRYGDPDRRDPDPADPNPVVTYAWAPTPLTGQGTAVATYRWQAVGSHPVTVTATNCGGPVTGTASVVVTDTVLPTWGPVSPAGWITTTQSPTVTVVVSDAQSGLDVSTGLYQFTTNGGSLDRLDRCARVGRRLHHHQPDPHGGLRALRHGTPALAGGQTRIRFRVRDMAGNLGASPEYTLTIDTLPPANPTSHQRRPADQHLERQLHGHHDLDRRHRRRQRRGRLLLPVVANETDLPPAVISTTALSAATLIPGYGQHWYFHVRAVDNVGHWSPTAAHQGPYWVGNAPPAFLTLDPESSGPGAEVILTGFGFDPQVTVSIGFTSTSGTHWLGTVQTSYDGVFQAAATVPDTATVGTAHGFIAQGGGKTGRAKFNVTPGMQILILNPNNEVTPGGYAWIKANYRQQIRFAGAGDGGRGLRRPLPHGRRHHQAGQPAGAHERHRRHPHAHRDQPRGRLHRPAEHGDFNVVVPVPPVPLTATIPTIHAAPTHGIRGTTVNVTGVAPSACRFFEIGGDDLPGLQGHRPDPGSAVDHRAGLHHAEERVFGSDIRKSTVEINPYTGQLPAR